MMKFGCWKLKKRDIQNALDSDCALANWKTTHALVQAED